MAISRFSTSSVAQGLPKYQEFWDEITSMFDSDYELIQKTTLSTSSNSVTFSSIPSTYRNLQIRYTARSTVANVNDGYTSIRFNNDSTSGNYYFLHYLQADGASVSTGALGTNTIIYTGPCAGNSASANVFGSGVIDILDYKSTNKNKITRALGGMDNNGAGKISLASGFWFSTAAITSITLGANAFGNDFMQYSSFALYGIKGAS